MTLMKLAVVGAGPSAFYVASRILSLLPAHQGLRVHLFDRLWAPHGLVRYGVAPDHPEVKNCTHKFDVVANDPRFRFFGNVNVGDTPSPVPHTVQLSQASLFKNYSHVLFATGCTLPTLHSALPPSEHCIPALSLVHWYTQHPQHPQPPPLHKIKHVSIIGNGNVSLDVARILLTDPSVLAKYDVPEHVLDVLARSSVEHVSIIARRGPLEAAFTMKELRELINLPNASLVPLDPSIINPPADVSLSRQQTRVLQLLGKGSKNLPGSTQKTWSLDFFRSPTGLITRSSSNLRSHLSLAHTTVDPSTMRAVPTGATTTLLTDLVITSLGFHAEPSSAYYDPGLRHLRTLSGRMVSDEGKILKGFYASGWAATGAKGVLASTMMNAYATADTILTDAIPGVVSTTPVSPADGIVEDGVTEQVLMNEEDLMQNPDNPPEEVRKGIEEGLVTQYSDWKRVDEEEVRRGESAGKERERMGWQEASAFLAKESQ